MAIAENELKKLRESELGFFNGDNELCANRKSPFRTQAFVALGSVVMVCGVGATVGYPAILIPQLAKDKDFGEISTEMVSWLASSASLALIFGNLLSGYFMEKFGRRNNQIIVTIPYILGWILIAFANHIYVILLGRFITGLCQGWVGPSGSVYIGETSTPIYRGLFLAGLSLALGIGIFLSHLFGTFLHWSYSALACGMIPIISFLILNICPESPSWLISKGKVEDGITNFYSLRGNNDESRKELYKIIIAQKNRKNNASTDNVWYNVRQPEFWKPLMIMVIFFIMNQVSGVNVVCSYTIIMVKPLLKGNMNEYTAMLLVDVLRCIALFIACIILRKVGRRFVAILSGSLTACSLIMLSSYLYLIRFGQIEEMSPIITLGLMSTYIIVSHIGIIPLPWNMVGEVFPTATKGLGTSITVIMSSITLFATVKSAPTLFQGIGFDGTYMLYGVAMVFGTVFLLFFLPETKNKTLIEIEEYFRKDQKNCKNRVTTLLDDADV